MRFVPSFSLFTLFIPRIWIRVICQYFREKRKKDRGRQLWKKVFFCSWSSICYGFSLSFLQININDIFVNFLYFSPRMYDHEIRIIFPPELNKIYSPIKIEEEKCENFIRTWVDRCCCPLRSPVPTSCSSGSEGITSSINQIL